MIIVPAILPQSLEDLEQKLARFSGLADLVQIDVIDGHFAAPPSWPYAGGAKELAERAASGENLPGLGTFKFDIDLMVENPEEVIGSWITLGATRITVHAESTRYLGRIIEDFDTQYGHDRDFSTGLLSLGLAVGTRTDLSLIEPFIKDIDYVQFMGIAQIGKQGQPFDPSVVERIRAFHRRHPDTEIQVDGGVNKRTAPSLLEAGVDKLIVGSALQNAPDAAQAFAELTALTEEYGLYE